MPYGLSRLGMGSLIMFWGDSPARAAAEGALPRLARRSVHIHTHGTARRPPSPGCRRAPAAPRTPKARPRGPRPRDLLRNTFVLRNYAAIHSMLFSRRAGLLPRRARCRSGVAYYVRARPRTCAVATAAHTLRIRARERPATTGPGAQRVAVRGGYREVRRLSMRTEFALAVLRCACVFMVHCTLVCLPFAYRSIFSHRLSSPPSML